MNNKIYEYILYIFIMFLLLMEMTVARELLEHNFFNILSMKFFMLIFVMLMALCYVIISDDVHVGFNKRYIHNKYTLLYLLFFMLVFQDGIVAIITQIGIVSHILWITKTAMLSREVRKCCKN